MTNLLTERIALDVTFNPDEIDHPSSWLASFIDNTLRHEYDGNASCKIVDEQADRIVTFTGSSPETISSPIMPAGHEFTVSRRDECRTVHKFDVHAWDGSGPWCDVELPIGARIVRVAQQAGSVRLWAIVDRDAPSTVTRRFFLAATGQDLPSNDDRSFPTRLDHVGTFNITTGNEPELVFHVFEQVRVG